MERKDTVRQAEYLHGNRKEEQPGNGKVAIYETMHTEDGTQEQPITPFMAGSVLLALFYGSCQSLTSRMAK